MNQKELQIWAQEYDSVLKCTDPRFLYSVSVHSHTDSTNMFFSAAFAIRKENFYIVFSEHNKYHFFHSDDFRVNMYKNMDIEKITKKSDKDV